MSIDQNTLYNLISDFLREDLGRGDVTTQAVIPGGVTARGKFVAKENAIICGLEVAETVFLALDPRIQLESFISEGDEAAAGKEFARVESSADVLLSGERLALNLVSRLSGIASLTRQYVDAVRGTNVRILDTRKTTPGLRVLEKYAVTIGGGVNHRFGLDDGVLIKDNHIALTGSAGECIRRARKHAHHLLKIEIEISDLARLDEALAGHPDAIMLDNMTPDLGAEAVKIIRAHSPGILIEISGNISLDNVRAFAECGPDFISAGALTHSAAIKDISFKITPVR